MHDRLIPRNKTGIESSNHVSDTLLDVGMDELGDVDLNSVHLTRDCDHHANAI